MVHTCSFIHTYYHDSVAEQELREQSTTYELPKEAKEVYDQVRLCYTTPSDPSCGKMFRVSSFYCCLQIATQYFITAPLYEYFQGSYNNFCLQFLAENAVTCGN